MRKPLLSLFFLVLLPGFILAQSTFKVKGKVTDAKTGETLIGANVVLKPSNHGGVTDINGDYSFDVANSIANGQTAELTASYINYKKSTVRVVLNGSNITQNFTLEEDVFQTEEVVVTGIASKTSKSISDVAVTRIPVAELTEKQNFQTLSQLFIGKVPGVKVSLASGNVGAGWSFFIRDGGGINGSGQPLIYIDGVRLDNSRIGYDTGGQLVSTLANLNPNDIENMEFLKGPAAASTYGTDASNGVVLITTKTGKGGVAVFGAKGYTVGYQYNYGVNSQVFSYPSTFSNADTATNPLFKNNGYIREHSLSLKGGTGMVSYFASVQNRFESGLIPEQNWMRRNNLRLNLNAVPSENLSVKFTSAYSFSKLRRPFNDNSVFGWLLNTLSYYPAYSRLKYEEIMALEDNVNTTQFVGSLGATWRPVNNLEVYVGAGIDNSFFENTLLYPVTYTAYSTSYVGRQLQYSRNGDQFTYDANVRYSIKDIFVPDLDYSVVVGSQILERKIRTRNISVQNFLHPDVTNLGAGAEVTAKDNSQSHSKQAGIFLENNFNYEDTYNLTLAFRRDYASAIGFEAPAITYPSAGLSVRLDKFDFIPKDFQLLKVRARYGESGQLPGLDDGLPLMYSAYSGGTGLGYGFRSIGNVSIEPERIKALDLGFDIEFLKMFSLEFSYYSNTANNSIVNASLAQSTGVGAYAVPTNIGGVEGHGYETSLRFNPIRTADYDLNFTLNWSYQTNKVTNLGEAAQITGASQGPSILKVGSPKWQFWAYLPTTPKFNATTQKYAGADITPEKVDLGNPFPDHSGTFALDFRFLKNFTLSALMEWGLNVKVWSYSVRRAVAAYAYEPVLPLQIQLGLTTRTKAGVTPLTPGTPEYIAAANEYVKFDPNVSGYGNYIFDADYFYFRELTLAYNFTELITEYLPNSLISELNAGLSVRNVFKTSKYEMDPDVNTNGGTVAGVGTDFATLPQPRTVNFWIRFNF